jgi:hypothetical protein
MRRNLLDPPCPGETAQGFDQEKNTIEAGREDGESGCVGWVDWRGRDWGWRGHLKGCCKISFPDKEPVESSVEERSHIQLCVLSRWDFPLFHSQAIGCISQRL